MKIRTLKVDFSKLFLPTQKQIVYIEDEYHPHINAMISARHDEISKRLQDYDFEFCYIPRLMEKFMDKEYIRYFTPYQEKPIPSWKPLDSTFMHPYIEDDYKPHAAFVVIYNYRFFSFEVANGELPLQNVCDFAREIYKEENYPDHCDEWAGDDNGKYDKFVRYCCDKNALEFNDSNLREIEMAGIMEEVRAKIEHLRQHGVSEMALQALLKPRVELSEMHIDEHGRITLPGYGNREIRMTPLVKSVYLLFLAHREGIRFKDLPSFRDELSFIYGHLTGRSSDEAIRKSINDVTDPRKNSINEKCARIREAFLREFDYMYARYYYIVGERGETKRIALQEDLIDNKFPKYTPKANGLIAWIWK